MAEPATNPNRPALYRVAAGTILKGARVEILGTTDQKPLHTLKPTDRVAVREFLELPPAGRPAAARGHRPLAELRARVAHEGRGGAEARVHG